MSANRERVETLLKQALDSLESEEPEAAVDATGEALSLSPGEAEAVHVLGLAAVRMDELLRAEELFRIAHDSKPAVMEHAEALAIVSAKLGRLNDALFFGKLSVSLPNRAVLQGLIPEWLGTFEDAVLAMDRRDAVDEARNLYEQGRFSDALGKYRDGIEAGSSNVEGWRGARDSLLRLGKPFDALLASQALSSIGKAEAADMSVVGTILTRIGRFEEGQACHVNALEGLPSDPAVRSAMIRDLAVQPDPAVEEIKQSERLWEISFAAEQEAVTEPDPSVFRLGVLSGRLRSGQGMEMIWPILAHAPKGAFELFVYSNNPADDTLARRIRGAVANWTDIRGIDDRTAARIIRNDGLSALLDLDGHETDGRPGVVAARPAPLVLNWFGEADAQSGLYDGFITAAGVTGRAGHMARAVPCFSPSPDTIVMPSRQLPPSAPFRIGLCAAPRKYSEALLKALAGLCDGDDRVRIVVEPNALGGVPGADDLEPRVQEHGFLDRLDYSPLTDNPVIAVDGFADAVDLVLEPGPDQDATLIWEMLSRSCPVMVTGAGPAKNKMAGSILSGLGLQDLVFETLQELTQAAARIAGDADAYNADSKLIRERMEAAVQADRVTAEAAGFFAAIRDFASAGAADSQA